MGADFLEQDIIACGSGELVVLHDLILDDVSDVADLFPGRARADGHFYCLDFDLAELRTLTFRERLNPDTGELRFSGRYPRSAALGFPVVTLAEEIQFTQSLNLASGRRVGIYPEIKQPAWHRQNGVDLSANLLDMLDRFGYLTGGGDPFFLQCFDADELKRLARNIGAGLPIIQLIGSGTEIDRQLLRDISSYAAGIGPSIKLIFKGRDGSGQLQLTDLVEAAHDAGLVVHPYTFRADELPSGFENFEALLNLFIDRLRVDGLFTDFTDRIAGYLSGRD